MNDWIAITCYQDLLSNLVSKKTDPTYSPFPLFVRHSVPAPFRPSSFPYSSAATFGTMHTFGTVRQRSSLDRTPQNMEPPISC